MACYCLKIMGCVGVTYSLNCLLLLENYRLCRCTVVIEKLLTNHRLCRCNVLSLVYYHFTVV